MGLLIVPAAFLSLCVKGLTAEVFVKTVLALLPVSFRDLNVVLFCFIFLFVKRLLSDFANCKQQSNIIKVNPKKMQFTFKKWQQIIEA